MSHGYRFGFCSGLLEDEQKLSGGIFDKHKNIHFIFLIFSLFGMFVDHLMSICVYFMLKTLFGKF